MGKTIIGLIILAGWLGCVTAATPTIRGGNFGNWWVNGETVVFKTTAALTNPAPVVGTVFDSAGKEIAKVEVPAAEMARGGWRWKPTVPGFYEVRFSQLGGNGAMVALTESMPVKAYEWIAGKPKLLGQQDYVRSSHNFAVLPSATRAPAEIPPQLAVSLGPAHERKPIRYQWANDNIRLAALLGFHAIRIHTVAWFLIEEKEGVYNWDIVDDFIATAQKAGFRDFIGNPFGTPKWVSSHPEKINLNICVWEYAAYAPVKMEAWTTFLQTLVKRYPTIKTWELWNEPHLPGQSVFWSESPEKYVELLRAGYQAVKAVQPESTIWLGGLGMRYLPFYEAIIKGGAGKYYDRLALHGSWVNPTPFEQVDRDNQVKSKPWVSSEWHAMLACSDDPKNPTDSVLARNMLVDFMNHIRQGAETVTFFTTANVPNGNESEMMDFYRKHKRMMQTFGLFRAYPYFEPRLGAVVWRNFTDCFAGRITYRDGYVFNGRQAAGLMSSDRGPVLFFWSNSDQKVKVDPLLASAVGPGSQLVDWEGRPQNIKKLELNPDTVYFLRNPDMKAVAGWTDKGQILKPRRQEVTLDKSSNGSYTAGRLLDDRAENIKGNAVWHKIERYVAGNGTPRAEGFNARWAAAFDKFGCDLLVDVMDRKHFQAELAGNIWQGDSIQFAIDTVGQGQVGDQVEFSAALTSQGPLLWKENMPSLGGDLSTEATPSRRPARHAAITVTRDNGVTKYRIHIDRRDLYPLAYMEGQTIRFSLLVNNNDGQGRAGYVEWASGIGNVKDPAQYGTLTVAVPAQVVLDQKSLRGFWGAVKLDFGTDSVKANCRGQSEKNASALSSRTVTVIPGAAYEVEFEVRGNVTLIVMAGLQRPGQKNERLDLIPRLALESENWKKCKTRLVVPPGVTQVSLSLFSWQQDGWFEVKNFRMATAAQP